MALPVLAKLLGNIKLNLIIGKKKNISMWLFSQKSETNQSFNLFKQSLLICPYRFLFCKRDICMSHLSPALGNQSRNVF